VIYLAAPLISRGVKFLAMLGAALVIVILMGTPMLGLLEQPLAPWWFSGKSTIAVDAQPGTDVTTLPLGNPPASSGGVTDLQRYLLAIGAGFSPSEAITATAISIAEDGSGDPAILSGRNQNGTFDLGLWQINSSHWGDYGGQAALTNPVTNAIAAHTIYSRAGWCSWSTYERSCGIGYTGAYAAFLGRARAAVPGGH
jgi:Lysozyme like domain